MISTAQRTTSNDRITNSQDTRHRNLDVAVLQPSQPSVAKQRPRLGETTAHQWVLATKTDQTRIHLLISPSFPPGESSLPSLGLSLFWSLSFSDTTGLLQGREGNDGSYDPTSFAAGRCFTPRKTYQNQGSWPTHQDPSSRGDGYARSPRDPHKMPPSVSPFPAGNGVIFHFSLLSFFEQVLEDIPGKL